MDVATAKKYYENYKKIKEYKEKYNRIKELWDDDTRSGAVFNEILNFTIKKTGELLGEGLEKHPYFVFHKTHISILIKAINASSISDSAERDWTRAAATAVQTNAVSNYCQSYKMRRENLVTSFGLFLREGMTILKNYRSNPVKGKADLAMTGGTVTDLQQSMDNALLTYRGQWCELAGEALSLLVMTSAQLEATKTAIDKYREKIEKLNKSNIFGRLFAGQQKEKEEWRQYEALVAEGPEADVKEAEGDPVGVATRAFQSIDKLSSQIAWCADRVMSNEPYDNPETLTDRLKGTR